MAALLKKRALAEYSKNFPECSPPKKLHLAKKPLIGSSAAAFVGLLEKCKSSNEALQLLLRISDCLQFQESDIEEAIKKLSEHFQNEEESAVRVKILWLFADIGLECPGANINSLVDESILLLKNETSHKVIAQGIATILKLGIKLSDDKILCGRLIGVAKDYLKDTSQQVKCRCLQLISEMYPICPEQDRTVEITLKADAILKLLADYTYSEDARVRSAAFNSLWTLGERGLVIPAALYDQACLALNDDYEIVREVALKIVWLIGNKYPENIITMSDGETTIRLVDDVFVKICSAVNDLCMQVRALACSLLGTTKLVSEKFLLQTLDKQLMSNMRKKRTAHERGAELVRSGEWASGRRWADDAPKEHLSAEIVSLVPGGAAGAFVHGLEDEFMEVRTAAVDAVCQLSLENPSFAVTSLDFLVDMFNDEIEEVRLRAIDSLTKISHHIVLREDQLEIILGALEDFSMDVREGLHRMLGACSLSSKTCLEMCVDKIMENLKRYPQDKRSTYMCVCKVGAAHSDLVLPLVTKLLAVHPFFDMPQPDVDDPAYVCILILVLNAARDCNAILSLLEEHTIKHYSYLRDTMSHLVPHLPIGDTQSSRKSLTKVNNMITIDPEDNETMNKFFNTILQHIDNANLSNNVRLNMLHSAEEQLNRLAEIEPSVSGAANFTAMFARTVMMLNDTLTSMNGPSTKVLEQLNSNCLRLQNQFSGMSGIEISCVRQLWLRVCVLKVVTMPSYWHVLTVQAESLDRYLADTGAEPDAFTISVFQQLSLLSDSKPNVLARALQPLLMSAPLPLIPKPNVKIRMCTASVLEPASETDNVLRFAAGLVTAVDLEAELLNVPRRDALRLKVSYPDRREHALLPQRDHLRPLDHTQQNSNGTENLRLLTKVLISHGVWTEPCGVDITICIAVNEDSIGRKEPILLDICKPVRVTVAPKPIKRGI